MIKVEEDGKVNVIHSADPAVRKEGLIEMAEEFSQVKVERHAQGKSAILGFKFLRLREMPMERLADKFNGAIPPVTMNGQKHAYLTEEQVSRKLERMKGQLLAKSVPSGDAQPDEPASE